jgi:hypothetical protein
MRAKLLAGRLQNAVRADHGAMPNRLRRRSSRMFEPHVRQGATLHKAIGGWHCTLAVCVVWRYSAIMFSESFIEQLVLGEVSFVIVGGMAMQLHGFQRMTYDLDLALAMDADNLRKFVTIAKRNGLRPTVPVSIESLEDPQQIDTWYREKGMLAFSLREPSAAGYVVDILVRPEVKFSELRADAVRVEFKGGSGLIASLDHLLVMKRRANRPKDQVDMIALEKLKKGLDPNG